MKSTTSTPVTHRFETPTLTQEFTFSVVTVSAGKFVKYKFVSYEAPEVADEDYRKVVKLTEKTCQKLFDQTRNSFGFSRDYITYVNGELHDLMYQLHMDTALNGGLRLRPLGCSFSCYRTAFGEAYSPPTPTKTHMRLLCAVPNCRRSPFLPLMKATLRKKAEQYADLLSFKGVDISLDEYGREENRSGWQRVAWDRSTQLRRGLI